MYKNSYRTDSGLADTLTAAAFSLILFLGRIGDGGLRSDNLLYASISKSVIGSGNPMMLHLGNDIYLNKPPLFFWLNSLFIRLFGDNVFAVKFLSALAAAILAVLIFKIARDIFKNVNAGYAAMLFFCLNYIIFKNSHACRPESLMTLFVIAGFYFGSRYADGRDLPDIVMAGVMFGLAVLVKGYIGILAFACMAVYLLYNRGRFSLTSLLSGLLLSLIIFLAMFSWWYFYIIKHTDFMNVFFFTETIDRFTANGMFSENKPAYTYLIKFIPYSALMLPFLIIGLRNCASLFTESSFAGMTSIFSLIYVAAIHFASTKYDRYLYPVIPILCIISASGFITLLRFGLRHFVISATAILCVFFCLYPGSTGSIEYNSLTKLQKTAEANGGGLCVSKAYENYWEHKAALIFFTDSYKRTDCTDKDIYINSPEAYCDGYTLEKTNRFSACLKTSK